MNGDLFQTPGGGASGAVGGLTDLAEGLGAVRLMRITLDEVQAVELPARYFKASPELPMYGFPMVLTVVSYALARGLIDVDALEGRLESQPDLRYLTSGRSIDSLTLRSFVENHAGLIRRILSRAFVEGVGIPHSEAAALVEQRLGRVGDFGLPIAA